MRKALIGFGLALLLFASDRAAAGEGAYVVDPQTHRAAFERFAAEEEAAIGTKGPDVWPWMAANIPWFESSDAATEEVYYFRWYAFRKHVEDTPRGAVITEFLRKVGWGGYYNSIVDAAPHHLNEARWLRNPKIAEDDARFWLSPDAAPRKYSVWLADAVRSVELATGDRQLGTDLLPALIADYRAWQQTQRDANGLYWSIDTHDAMEKSISGDGYRPTLNSYMYGDAVAVAAIAKDAGQPAIAAEFRRIATAQRKLVDARLWNAKDRFYEVLSPSPESGLRQEKKFKDNGTALQLAGVRELIGYIPWYFHLPSPGKADAWRQLFDPAGFDGAFGPTTAERRSPRFRFANSDQCQWNGPSWPFATTQTLVALANFLTDQPNQTVIDRGAYYRLFHAYVASHRLKLADGRIIPWIDENLDADTGEWIARGILAARRSPSAGRGAYYNHSGFADPLITGLIGLKPRADNLVRLDPLLPDGVWSYFALDGLPYHGHLLSIVYDQSGSRYHRGRGLMLFVDGKLVARRATVGRLDASLTAR